MKKLTKKTLSLIMSLLTLLILCCVILVGVGANIDVQQQILIPAVSTLPADQAELILKFSNELSQQVDLFLRLFSVPIRVVFVLLIFVAAVAIHRMAWTIAGALLNSRFWSKLLAWSSYGLKATGINLSSPRIRAERQRTIQLLVASTISIVAFSTAVMFSLSQFLDNNSLAVITGLFTAAFGFGARTLIGDLLAGISNIFEDNFDVGEKVEIAHVPLPVEGVVESVNLRTTSVRAPTGELIIIPNGEIRVMRNYSRGRFSTANVKLKVAAADLERLLLVLEDLGRDAVSQLPNLLEPWQIISEEGAMGEHTELTLLVKAKFGQAATLRPNLLALVQKQCQEASISLVD